jgi:hypothetical protein
MPDIGRGTSLDPGDPPLMKGLTRFLRPVCSWRQHMGTAALRATNPSYRPW